MEKYVHWTTLVAVISTLPCIVYVPLKTIWVPPPYVCMYIYMYIRILLCIYLCVHIMYMCSGVCRCACILCRYLPHLLSTLLVEQFFPVNLEITSAGWPASPGDSSYLSPQHWDYWCVLSRSPMGAGGSKSGSHACITSALLAEPSPGSRLVRFLSNLTAEHKKNSSGAEAPEW